MKISNKQHQRSNRLLAKGIRWEGLYSTASDTSCAHHQRNPLRCDLFFQPNANYERRRCFAGLIGRTDTIRFLGQQRIEWKAVLLYTFFTLHRSEFRTNSSLPLFLYPHKGPAKNWMLTQINRPPRFKFVWPMEAVYPVASTIATPLTIWDVSLQRNFTHIPFFVQITWTV